MHRGSRARHGVARRSPFCGYESDGDESPSSQSRFAGRREDRPGCYLIARESAARASGESRESKRGQSKLRAENPVSLRGPAYQVDNASALPSPRFEMLSLFGFDPATAESKFLHLYSRLTAQSQRSGDQLGILNARTIDSSF